MSKDHASTDEGDQTAGCSSLGIDVEGIDVEGIDVEAKPVPAMVQRIKRHLLADVDPERSSFPLAAYCFMTGFVDAITFTAVSVWCGFQTVGQTVLGGNTIELSLALARLFARSESPGPSFRIVDRQSLTSILAFLAGAFVGRVGDRMGAKTRAWLMLGTFFQALCTMAAAILLWQDHQSDFPQGPTWTKPQGYAAIAFASASMGLQGIMGKRVNTQFATTIVLTTVWCELMAEPSLFKARLVKSRDLKVIAVTSLFLGGFTGRALLGAIGSPATLGIGTGLRVLITLSWLQVPAMANAA